MLKIRLQGTTNDIKWFRLHDHPVTGLDNSRMPVSDY